MSCKAEGFTACSGRPCAGYCNKHYLQMQRYGKLKITNRDKRDAIVVGRVAKIPLGINAKDGYAIVDKEFAYLAQDNWHTNHYGYVRRAKDHKLMSRLILKPNNKQVVDHIDGNKLDNRTSNIRVCTQADNTKNQKLSSRNRTGYKGVSQQRTGSFRARIKTEYKQIELGAYSTAIEAARAYNKAAKKYYAEFARLNILKEV